MSAVTSLKFSKRNITKRDGRRTTFDRNKILSAIKRCFVNGVRTSEGTASHLADQVTSAVVNILGQHRSDLGVEDVQRYVLQQLWAQGHFEAAEHYQNYREQRRKEREVSPVNDDFAKAVAEDAKHFPTPLQYYQFISKFARFKEDLGRRETWRECCDRVMNWFRGISKKYNAHVSDEEWESLDSALYNLEASCAMRVVQMAGPALERCEVGCYNCAYAPIDSLESFAELLYILMQGSGVGFSVEYDYISLLPRIKKQKEGKKAVVHKIIVEDSTEGWCDAYLAGLKAWFNGEDAEFDLSLIRPAGARLKTKGGRASGPLPLKELLDFARRLILSRQGGYLTDLDVHDLCCVTGKIVQVGGVRRASCISLSDLDSLLMRDAKSGTWYEKAKWRTMSNNSSVYEEKPDAVEFMEEWLALAKSGSGERGIFNRLALLRHLPKRRKRLKYGTNPCAEIVLRPKSFCNLTIAVARLEDTEETLTHKVTTATFFGKLQSLCTDFKYISSNWSESCKEERLLGVDITGHADCPILRYGASNRAELLQRLAKVVEEKDLELSKRWNINQSPANTCVKPGGDSGVFFDCGSGVSPRFSDHQIRNVRQSVNDPVTQLMKDEGVPWAVAPEDESLVVFSFPKASPEGSTTRDQMTAIEQLENWLEWKLNWAEHSVSCTVYVDTHEWLAVGNWVYEHFDDVLGISFLPRDNGSYVLAPNEQITKEQYDKMVAEFPAINWSKLTRYEREDCTTSHQVLACSGDKCEI